MTARIGWASGGAGSTTMLYLVNAMLLYFMITQWGVQPAVAGALLLGVRLYDGVLDMVIGTLSDRTRSRWGRRRPWMAAGALVSAAGTVAIFLPPLSADASMRQVQITLAVLLFFTGYSMFSVPSSAMPAEMTTDPAERTSLMSWRTFFLQLAGLTGGAGAPWLVARLGSGMQAYTAMACVAAVFVLVTMAASVLCTGRVAATKATGVSLSRGEAILTLLGNRPFMALLGIKFCGYIGIAAMGAVGLFFVRDVLGRDESAMAQIQLVTSVVGMACLPVWSRMAGRYGKVPVYVVALVLSIAANASWLMASAQEPAWLLLARAFAVGFASTGGLLMSLSMLPDAIEYDFMRTGLRREGVYSGVFEFFQKAAYAVAPFAVGLFLQWNGYVAGAGAAQQSPQAIAAVRLTMGGIPVVTYGAALLILLTAYRLPSRPRLA
ncbi:MFS transporter [Novosphingobium sp. AP12]|uniref:MFS transporter n=1 Tax=Novosphingobium sp. AP12 TaxID=1144305 RepID=UPI001EE661DA|nr:MFS transporter [Novosphingobium sp. AP12]